MLALAHLWFSTFGRVAVVLLFALCLGYPVVRRLRLGGTLVPIALLTGLALLSTVVCLLSWLQIFTKASMVATAAVGAAASAWCARADRRSWREQWARRRGIPPTAVICMAILAVALLGFSLLTLYPSTAFDATSYHLPLARSLVRHHGLVYDPFIRYSFFPQANESLFAVMLLLTPTPAASAALEFSVLAIGALLLPLWFIRSGRSVGGGFFAALILLASPVVIWSGTAAFVDTWTMTFLLAAFLLGLDAAEERAGRPTRNVRLGVVALAGAMAGEALAAKYTGALFGACAAAGVLVAAKRPRALLAAVPAALGGLLVVAGPWYAWTLHVTGDPLYPYATNIFGNRSGLWTPLELQVQKVIARAAPLPGVSGIFHRDLQYLEGHVMYDTGPDRSPLSWLLGIGLLRLLVPSAWRDRTLLGVALATAACFVASVFISADPRYLVPALGIPAVCAGLAADWAVRAAAPRLTPSLRRPQLVVVPALACAVLALWSAGGYGLDYHSANGNPATAVKHQTAYLDQRIPCYAAVGYLNVHIGRSYRAWGYSCEQARYYARGRLIGDEFSQGSRSRVFDNGGSTLPPDTVLWQRLRGLRVGWVILPHEPASTARALQQHRLFRFVTAAGPMDIFRLGT